MTTNEHVAIHQFFTLLDNVIIGTFAIFYLFLYEGEKDQSNIYAAWLLLFAIVYAYAR